ncbi:DNA alkylation repair protein [Streptomyces sp. NPDC057757]|uniref:DNA alkylation repair protein n=1 Tax=Streptomyces sp. NPDC057757 TaxID=3346241 RepID=UPI00368E489B
MGVTASGTSDARPEMPNSVLADTLLARLTATYAAAADPQRAASMRAYMKDVAPFLGLTTPDRRALSRTVLLDTPPPRETDCTAVALRCWALPEREYRYFAVDYLQRHVRQLTSGFLPVARYLVSNVPWWDTVDALAAHVVGGLVAADPRLKADMDAWIEDDDLWVARTALLHQLRRKDATDTERLFGYCVRQAGHPDFFIRKAIGWCLREYAKTDPEAVREFVARERGRLSPLSAREALKNIGP